MYYLIDYSRMGQSHICKVMLASQSSAWQEKSWLEMHFHQKWKWGWFKPVGWERNFLHYINVISEGQVTARRCELCKRLLSITCSFFYSSYVTGYVYSEKFRSLPYFEIPGQLQTHIVFARIKHSIILHFLKAVHQKLFLSLAF